MARTGSLRIALMGTALTGLLAAAPLDIRFNSEGFSLAPSLAFAKDGQDDDDREDEQDDDRDSDDSSGHGRDDDDDRQDDDRGRDDDDDDHGRGAQDIEVTLEDGSRIEIENGRFERKDARGRTVEERPATAADIAQYVGAASRSSNDRRGGGLVAKAERGGDSMEVVYSDGWKEEIEAGRYELKDPMNRTVVERRATASDQRRLSVAFR